VRLTASARLRHDLGHVSDRSYVRRELDDEGRCAAARAWCTRYSREPGSEPKPFRRRERWGRNVELVSGDAFGLIEALDDAYIFANGIAEDVDDDFGLRVLPEQR